MRQIGRRDHFALIYYPCRDRWRLVCASNLLEAIMIVCVVTQHYEVTFTLWCRFLEKIIIVQLSKYREMSINIVTTITDNERFRFPGDMSHTLEKLTSFRWMWSCFCFQSPLVLTNTCISHSLQVKICHISLNKTLFHCSGKFSIGEPWHDNPLSV